MSTVAVTGGSGFVGAHVITALRSAGHTVIDVGRRPARVETDWFVPVQLASTDPGAVPDLGTLPVVNCAAAVGDGRGAATHNINHAITRSVLRMTAGRLVHVSSSSVYDITRPSVAITPETTRPDHPWHGSYGLSKYNSERQVLRAEREAVILRPHAVYGAGDTTLMPTVRRAARGGFLVLPRGGRALHALTAVENLAAAVVAALSADVVGTRILNVTDDDPVPLRTAFRAVLGRPRLPVVPVPVPVARTAARATGERAISEYAVLQVGYQRTYDLTETERVLRWRPRRGTLERLTALGEDERRGGRR